MHKLTLTGLALALLGGLAVAPAANAQTTAYQFTLTGATNYEIRTNFSGSVGFTFTIGSQDVVVSSLGIYDGQTGNLVNSHPVAIYAAGGGPALATVTVDSTAAVTTDATGNNYAYASISPLTLAANTTYQIMALEFSGAGNDPFVDRQNNAAANGSGPLATIKPLITFGTASYSVASTTAVTPSTTNSRIAAQGPGYFGPNFQLAAAPEPSETTALGLGILGLVAMTLKARKRAR